MKIDAVMSHYPDRKEVSCSTWHSTRPVLLVDNMGRMTLSFGGTIFEIVFRIFAYLEFQIRIWNSE